MDQYLMVALLLQQLLPRQSLCLLGPTQSLIVTHKHNKLASPWYTPQTVGSRLERYQRPTHSMLLPQPRRRARSPSSCHKHRLT